VNRWLIAPGHGRESEPKTDRNKAIRGLGSLNDPENPRSLRQETAQNLIGDAQTTAPVVNFGEGGVVSLRSTFREEARFACIVGATCVAHRNEPAFAVDAAMLFWRDSLKPPFPKFH